jgi:hypothetical protein
VGILFLLTITSVDAILGNDAGLTLTLNPNITNYVTNNYTTINNTYMGGFLPNAPWLYNDTDEIFFNYSRLIQEFYNKSQIDSAGYLTSESDPRWQANSTLVRYKSEELSWSNLTGYPSACGGGQAVTQIADTLTCSAFLTAESDPYWNANSTAALNQTATNVECNDCVTASDIGTINACSNICTDSAYNATYESTYNVTYHNYWAANLTNRSNYWDGLDSPLSSWTDTYNATYHAKWDECSDASGCGWLTSYTETDPLWSGNATAALSTYNATYAATSVDVTANRTDWLNRCYNATYESTYNATYAGKQNDIGANCDTDNYVYGVQDDGTLLCRADQVGGGGGSGDKWVDGGSYIYPNTTFADNVFIMGWIKAYNWTNVSITESQITDFGTYLESESDPRWQGNSSLVVYTSQTSAWDKDSTDDITTANIASQNVNSSNYWDNYDTPPSAWTDTYNVTYHNYWQLNSTNSSRYWGNFLVSSGACSNVCTDADTDTWNTTEQMQDACGALLGGTETRMTATYDDANNDIDFVVDDMNDDTPDSDAEVPDDITIDSTKIVNTSANMTTTANIRVIQNGKVCLDSPVCSKYIFYNGTDVVIQG